MRLGGDAEEGPHGNEPLAWGMQLEEINWNGKPFVGGVA